MGSCIGTASSSTSASEHRQLWQDRQIRWDQPRSLVAPRTGEIVIKKFENIEDTKGENGLGVLTISNLRLMWTATHNPKLNISIGYGNIAYIHFNMTDSPTFGRIRAPHMMTQLGTSRFEFTFASRNDVAMPLFSDLDNALRRYRATRMFRDLVLRDEHLMKDGQAVIYYGETLIKEISGCENLTTDEKFPGIMFVTDRRIVWNSTRTPNINVSVPFIQFRAVGTRTSNFGTALVIETTQVTGGYILGFKFHNQNILSEVQSLLLTHFNLRKVDPFFGPLDGVVQYLDDRLVVVAEDQISPATSSVSSSSSHPSSPQQQQQQLASSQQNIASSSTLLTPRSQAQAAVVMNQPPLSSARRRNRSPFALLTSACLDVPGGSTRLDRIGSRDNSFGSGHSLTLLSDSSSPGEIRTIHSNVGGGISHNQSSHQGPIALGEPLNLRHADPLPIGLQLGQAAVVYSAANQVANNQAELLLSISPSSRKYRAPRCVVCMATPTEAAFDPCGHLCSCMKCAAKLKHCPICRSEVQKMLRIYLQAA